MIVQLAIENADWVYSYGADEEDTNHQKKPHVDKKNKFKERLEARMQETKDEWEAAEKARKESKHRNN